MQFIFFGRLSHEKGIDSIIDCRQRFVHEKKQGVNNHIEQANVFIFGDGPYYDRCRKLSQQSDHIHTLGWQNRETIKRYLQNSDYCVMPSRFLETFGLSAIESLNEGVPVIGPRQGGLEATIFPQLDMLQQAGTDWSEKLYHLVTQLITHPPTLPQPQTILQQFTKDKWVDRVHQLLTTDKLQTILMISDYKTQLGGIETYLHKSKNLLKQHGHTVHIIGATIPKNKRGKLIRYLGLTATIANVMRAVRIRHAINTHQPDLLWRNSVSRLLGWLPLRTTKTFSGKQRMMYHDLGYFYPFPHKLTSTNQLPTRRSLWSFIRAAATKNPLILIAVIAKFGLLHLLRKQLRHSIDHHLVPSSFMKPIIQQLYNTHTDKTNILSHCISTHD